MAERGNSANAEDNVTDIRAGVKGGRVTLDDIVGSADTPTMEFRVPEWGNKTIVIQGLTKQQQVDIRENARVGDVTDETLVSKGIFREGVVEPRFTPEQVSLIWEKQAGIIDGILMTIIRLSGMDKESSARWERLFRSRA